MKLEHLLAHGFSQRTVDNWARSRDSELLPLQAHVVAHTGLLQGRSVAIFAPTSAGKTFVGELAALRHIERGGRAVFGVPTKALAEELAHYMRATYSPLGLRLCVATSEQRSDDLALAAGQFDLAIVVYEKLRASLTAAPELTNFVTCFVADELQILGDDERGPLADLLLTKFIAAPRPPQLVTMSAVVDDHERLASWLGAEVVVWHERPVELREGVLCCETGTFHYREWNTRREATEPLCPPQPSDGLPLRLPSAGTPALDGAILRGIIPLARELVEQRHEQLLIFVPTKALSRDVAARLAKEIEAGSAPERLAHELDAAEDSLQTDLLRQLMARGVAFHNADLPQPTRRLIERAFDAGDLRLLVATSTLAQGVNLSCQNVVSVPSMVVQGETTSQPVMVPISRARLRNQGGRAGRYRRARFGRSIVVAEGAAEAERLFDLLLRSPAEPIVVRLSPESIAASVLDLVVANRAIPGGLPRSKVAPFIARTFAARVMDAATISTTTDSAIAHLASLALIEVRGDCLLATGTGEVAAAYGLDPQTVAQLREHLERFAERPPSDELTLLLAVATTPRGAAFPLCATPWEIRSGKYLHLYRDYLREIGATNELLPMRLPSGGATAADHAALKKAFLALAWISDHPTRAIENTFRILAGTIEDVAFHLAWLLEALAALSLRLTLAEETATTATLLAERLRYGATNQALALARAYRPLLTRSHIGTLVRAGLDSPEALRSADNETLRGLLPRTIVEALHSASVQPIENASGATAWPCEMKPQGTPAESPRSVATMAGTRAVAMGAEPSDATGRPAWERTHALRMQDEVTNRAPVDCPSTGSAHADPTPWPKIEIDTRSPGVVRVNGVRLFMSALPFKLFAYLARHPQRVVPYEEIDAQLWPDAKVEQQQILAHKATIVRRLTEVLGAELPRTLLKTVAGQGLCLDVPPIHLHVK